LDAVYKPAVVLLGGAPLAVEPANSAHSTERPVHSSSPAANSAPDLEPLGQPIREVSSLAVAPHPIREVPSLAVAPHPIREVPSLAVAPSQEWGHHLLAS